MTRRGIAVGGWRAALVILGMEICERLATLGIGLNLVTYLHDQLHFTIPAAANTVTNFFGTSFILCLLGGFIADSYLGRYGTIVAGTCFQLFGMIMMVLSSLLRPEECRGQGEGVVCEPPRVQHQAVLYAALYMIAIGTGGIKPCVLGLGAEQWEEEVAEGRRSRQSFFNLFGVGLAVASILAATLLAYVQDNAGRAIGFTISAACTIASLLLFLLASPFYRTTPPSGSPLSFIARIFLAAWQNRHLPHPPAPPPPSHYLSAISVKLSTVHHTNQLLFLDKAALAPQSTMESKEPIQSTWVLSSLEGVEEVKMFLRLFPIWATTIIFWTVNAQMLTFSVEQAATLDRRLGGGFEVPPTSFTGIGHVTAIITLPFYDRILLPLARKWRENEYGITSLQRIGIGLILCTLSMIVAALVERKRLHVAQGSIGSMIPMSALYLIPQYVIIGLADAFAYIGQIDFFFGESPSSMRSLGTGLCLSTLSFGFFLSGALVSGVNKLTKHGSHQGWLTNNLNVGRLDNFYLFIAVCSFLSFLAFLVCSHWYVYNHAWSIINTSQLEEGAKCQDEKAICVDKMIKNDIQEV